MKKLLLSISYLQILQSSGFFYFSLITQTLKSENLKSFEDYDVYLKLVSTIFYQIFIFSPNDSPSKTIKNVFYFIKKAPFVLEIFKFLYFFPFLCPFQTRKDKRKWNNLCCHELACINLQMQFLK